MDEHPNDPRLGDTGPSQPFTKTQVYLNDLTEAQESESSGLPPLESE